MYIKYNIYILDIYNKLKTIYIYIKYTLSSKEKNIYILNA